MSHFRFALLGILIAAPLLGAQQRQIPGTFRSRITVVPLDVRVVDRNGTPVTDLRQDDFTIIEDGKPQDIAHFSFERIEADASLIGEALELRRPPGGDIKAQERRVFLIVLGRGRLQGPAKGVDGAIAFVRDRLLPQDLVAVQAYNRAIGFSTDHGRALDVLRRFKSAHEEIENKLRNRAANIAGSRPPAIPPGVQRDIDDIFAVTDARTLAPGSLTNDGRVVDVVRQAAERALQENIDNALPTDPNIDVNVRNVLTNETAFSEFMAGSVQSLMDLGTLFTAIEYMRFLEGEKHIVFISENGMLLPGVEDDKSLTAMAADARVAIDTIRTGGVQNLPTPTVAAPLAPGNQRMLRSTHDIALNNAMVRGSSMEPAFTAGTMKTFAQLTGGQHSLYEPASSAFARIDQTTRSAYLIGYYPSNSQWDGGFRRVRVQVKRPGLTVHHRFGYYARSQLVPFNRREFMAYARIASAGASERAIRDIEVSLDANVGRTPSGMLAATVEGKIDISNLSFVENQGRFVGALDIAVFCGDGSESLVGERRERIDLRLSPENHQKARAEGLGYTTLVSLKSMPRYVKVVVYDHAADLVGTASATVSPREKR